MAIRFASLAVCLGLAACVAGPDFETPPPPAWLKDDAGQAGVVVFGEAVDPSWWTLFGDPVLNDLVAKAAARNLDVQTALARLEESRAQRGVTAAGLYPTLDGSASYTREKQSDKGVIGLFGGGASGSAGGASTTGFPAQQDSPPFNLYQYGFDASWELDLWGRVRRGVEAADATVQASEEDLHDVRISTVAELVRDYVELRDAQAQAANARENLRVAEETLALAQSRAKAGLTSDLDVTSAAAQVANAAAQLPSFESQARQARNAIALLLALPPGALGDLLGVPNPIPPAPPRVPVGLPSELLKRRPDIRRAEARLHAATAGIGAAKADFFPRITLMGNGAIQALQFRDLDSWGARTYSFGPSIRLPLFEGGRLVATLEMRKAEQKEAAIAYAKTVLAAFHDADNALTAFAAEEARAAPLARVVEADRLALDLAQNQYAQGLVSYLNVLSAERDLLQAQNQASRSAAAADTAVAQLYKALGGGWETEVPQAPPAKAAEHPPSS